MNWKIKTLFICLSVFLTIGCSSMTRPLHYGVGIENKGKEMIVVDPFQIADGSDSIVGVGEAYPGGVAGMSPFYTKPFQSVNIAWYSSATGARGSAQARLNLPKEFTKERGSEIRFYIFPEEQKVDVAYEIFNPKTGETYIIRQPVASH